MLEQNIVTHKVTVEPNIVAWLWRTAADWSPISWQTIAEADFVNWVD